jgi:hypothetical protein
VTSSGAHDPPEGVAPADPFALLRELNAERSRPPTPPPPEPDIREVTPVFTVDLPLVDDDDRYGLVLALKAMSQRVESGSWRNLPAPWVVALRGMSDAARRPGPFRVSTSRLDRGHRETIWRVLTTAAGRDDAHRHVRTLADRWEIFTFGPGGYRPTDAELRARAQSWGPSTSDLFR